jgi:hypothetical protein
VSCALIGVGIKKKNPWVLLFLGPDGQKDLTRCPTSGVEMQVIYILYY